ncbi:MAG: DinB family protein [Limisphaerales bacterium]
MKPLALDLARRYRAYTLAAVEGLIETDFHFRPKEKAEANSIAWILWHLAEVTDWFLWGMLKQEPVFLFGHSHLNHPAEKPYPPSKQLLEYLDSSHQRYLDWLEKVEIADYEAKVEIPDFAPSTWSYLLLVLPIHERGHAAQIRYIRRLLGKPLPDTNAQNIYKNWPGQR